MGAETVVTLALVAVLVAVLAIYVLAVGLALRKLSFTLGTIVIGLRAIAQQTRPVGAVVGDLIADVDVIDDALESLIGAVVTAKKVPAAAPAPAPAVVATRPSPSGSGVGVDDGDDWDAVMGDVDGKAPVANAVGELTLVGGRRSKARSSGRGPGAKGRARGSTSDAVARARERVDTR